VERLYGEIFGEYWPPQRCLVEKHYWDIGFLFAACPGRNVVMTGEWNLQQLCGYFTSCSALQRYRKNKGSDPLELMIEDLHEAWRME
jgi:hypothetical protein